MLADLTFNVTTRHIIGAAIDVHRALGPGLLESAYIPCLQYEPAARKLRFVTEHAVPIVYTGVTLDTKYRIDLIVEGAVIVEVKAVELLLPVHQAQVLTYMRLTGCPGGLLINFNVAKLIDGVKRPVASAASASFRTSIHKSQRWCMVGPSTGGDADGQCRCAFRDPRRRRRARDGVL